MRDCEKRRKNYEHQLEQLKTTIQLDQDNVIDINELIEEAKKVIANLDFSNKFKVVRDIISKVVLKGGQEVEVYGRIPIYALNMGYEPKGWDSHFTAPYLDFEYEFIAPKPRKERIIMERDVLGRIISSKPPAVSY